MNGGRNFNAVTAAIGLSVLGLGGCLAIYGARAYAESPLYFTLRQMACLVPAVILFALMAKVRFDSYLKYAKIAGGIMFFLLVLVLAVGVRVNGMRGWLPLWSGAHFQPSEFAKPFFLLLICVFAADVSKDEKIRFRYVAGITAVFALPVALEPDFGGCSIYLAGAFFVLVAAGFSMKYIWCTLGASVLACGIFVASHPYAFRRIIGFLSPENNFSGTGWHVKQFQYTLAHGGLFGADDGGAVWANAYLPLSHSDSAFAAIVESTGFFGGAIVMTGVILMVWIFRRTALRSDDMRAKVFLFSAGAMCAAQALLHISVNSAMIPTTGVTLPVFSYGGSSLFSTMMLFGMACSAGGCEKSR